MNFENVPWNFETFGELVNFSKNPRNVENVKEIKELSKMFQEILKMFVRTRF